MYQRQNPYVISQTLTSTQTFPIQLTDKNLMGYVLTDMNGKYIYDPSLFYFELRKFNYKLDSNGVYQVAYYDSEVLKPCKSSVTFTNESVCFTNKSLYLNGSSNNRDYHIFTVSIFLCNNKTSNGTCKSKEDILKFFSTPKFFACHLPGVEIDVKDYEDPMKIKRTASYYLIDPTLRKRNYIYLKQVELFSDEGWIIEDKNYFKDFKLDYQTMDFNTRVEGDPLYQYLFFASYSHDLVNRRYQRLPEFLGSFSGTTQLIIIISSFFVNISIYVKSLKKILNSLYTFPSQY